MFPASGDDSSGRGRTQSLYRKYRPASFDSAELVGQSHISDTLRNAITHNRIAHAYLFCGPRGTGKTSTARLLAKAVNCLDPDPANRPCNACDACRAVNEGRTTDIVEIDAASNRGIDDIRELREQVRYAPSQLRHKFYIIDEAHQITPAGFNAFLKTLEEPPANITFVLATTDPDKLPDTIASRCQRFDFRRIPREPMVEHIRAICAKEGLAIDDDAIEIVVRRATGSLRDALSMVDLLATSATSTETGRIDVTLTRRMLGISADGWALDLAIALADRDVTAGLAIIGHASDAGQDMRSFARQIGEVLRLLLLVRAGANPIEADGRVRELAGRFELAELLHINERFSELDFKVRTAGLAQLPIEIAVVGALVEQPAVVQIAPQPEQPRAPRPAPQRAAPASAPPSSWTTPPAEAPSRSATRASEPPRGDAQPATPISQPQRGQPTSSDDPLTHIRGNWDRVRAEVKTMNGKVEALLRESDPDHIADGTLYLMAPYSFHTKMLNDPAAREVVETAIARMTGILLQVNTLLRPERELGAAPPRKMSPAPRAAAAPSPTEATAEIAETPSEGGMAESAGDYRVDRARAIFDASDIDPDELTTLR